MNFLSCTKTLLYDLSNYRCPLVWNRRTQPSPFSRSLNISIEHFSPIFNLPICMNVWSTSVKRKWNMFFFCLNTNALTTLSPVFQHIFILTKHVTISWHTIRPPQPHGFYSFLFMPWSMVLNLLIWYSSLCLL